MTQIKPTREKGTRVSYLKHNYDAINSAVAAEEQRVKELLGLSRHKKYVVLSKSLALIAGAIGVLILALVVAWSLLAKNGPMNFTQPPERATESFQNDNERSVRRSYTEFDSVPLPNGESVVTGRRFTSSDTTQASSQYCYLASWLAPEEQQTPLRSDVLAEVISNEIVILTADQELRSLAERYCNFKVVAQTAGD